MQDDRDRDQDPTCVVKLVNWLEGLGARPQGRTMIDVEAEGGRLRAGEFDSVGH